MSIITLGKFKRRLQLKTVIRIKVLINNRYSTRKLISPSYFVLVHNFIAKVHPTTKTMDDQSTIAVGDQRSFCAMALQFLYRILVLSVRFLMVRIYGERGQSVPACNEPLLLESATSIAEKIRTKQVSTHYNYL